MEAFITTHNANGYMLQAPDQVMQACIEFVNQRKNAVIVDVGAAYGIATLVLLQQTTAKVIANDIDAKHLDVLLEETPKNLRSRLLLQQKQFPDETKYDEASIDAFLVSRVFHFFTGDQITQSLSVIYHSLKPQGKVFISVASPYMHFLKKFISVYESNLRSGMQWPGEMINHYEYCPKDIDHNAPEFFHVMTPEILSMELQKSGFIVEKAEFYSREDCPEYIKYDGRESCMIIGRKG